jgi:3-deoxy-manno-octulosonate cytidylyltransferase (CMP-KDO synthetase)
MKTLAVIPARYASTRFPGKPLVKIGEKTMIQRVYEQVSKATRINKVIVATDDERIYNHMTELGASVMMTQAHHTNGTERCAEVIESVYDDFEIVVNVQGDEPFILPEQIDQLVRCFDHEDTDIATLVKQTDNRYLLFSPTTVKVVYDKNFRALYFSRQPIPYLRGVSLEEWAPRRVHYLHVGIYGFRKEVLREIVLLPPSSLESLEMLEQLRWLENGYSISIAHTDYQSLSVDSPEDLENAIKYLELHPEFA